MLEVKYVDYGIANNFGTHIEMNKHLKDYPDLHEAILKHEMGHTDRIFTKQDLIADLKPLRIKKRILFRFMIRHPKALFQFLPIYITKKHGLVYDINLILIYSFIISISMLSVWLGFKL